MKRECCRHPRASRGFAALIEILVVAVLILGGMILYMNMSGGSGVSKEVQQELNTGAPTSGYTAPQSLAGKAVQRAYSTQCQSNLRQLRMMVDMAKGENTDGKCPPSLEGIQGTDQIRICPVCHQPYTYDPETGQVKCPFPDHANY